MAMTLSIRCRACGSPLSLDCGDFTPEGSLDLTLECNNCEAPKLNAFVPLDDFQPVE